MEPLQAITEEQLNYVRFHQEELGLKLARHCCIVAAQNYGWNPDQTLPLGKYPDLLACEVLQDFFDGTRNFNPAYGVEIQLKNAIRSELSTLYRRKEAQAHSFQTGDDDAARDFAITDAGPAEIAMNRHDKRVLFELFASHPHVKGNEDLENLLIAIDDGADDTSSQAEATGLDEKRVYELRRQLREICPSILRQFNQLPCTK